jgi:hypothetical protein
MMPQKKTTSSSPSPRRQFRKQGQSLIEYSLILGGLSLAVLGTLMLLGDSFSDRLTGISDELSLANTNYFTRLNLSVAPKSNADKTDANSNLNLFSKLNVDFVNPANPANQGLKSNAASLQSTRLTLRNTNGGEMNVSSAEGIARRAARAQRMMTESVFAQGVFALAETTNSSRLRYLSQQALLSASLQATYQMVTEPSNPTNDQLKDLTKITTQNNDIKMLAKDPDRILSSIESRNNSMEDSKAAIMQDKKLTTAQQTQAVSLIDQMIQSTREAYDLNQLPDNVKALNEPKTDDKAKTYTRLYDAAEKAMESDLNNAALETTLTNGMALNSSP